MLKKSSIKNRFNIDQDNSGEKLTSNSGVKHPVERLWCTQSPQTMNPTYKKVGKPGISTSYAFRRGMDARELKVEIFILEDELGFKDLNGKEKITRILEKSDSELKLWYYELAIDGLIPSEWAEFKDLITSWCLEKDISCLKKYRDELWSSYIRRLKNRKYLRKNY